MFWNEKNECTRIVATDTGNGLAKIDVHGSSLRVAGMLVAALVTVLGDCRNPESTNEQLADGIRDMVLEGLEEMSNAGK